MSEHTNGHSCEMTGCIAHFESETASGKPLKKMYKFRVHFRSQQEIYDHAMESMRRVVAYKARSDSPIPIRENGAYVDIYEDGTFTETLDDRVNAYLAMSEKQKDDYRAKIQAEYDAIMKSQSVAVGATETKKVKV
jgi:hypothetical protein